jgi:hypothetical protein
MQQAEQLLYAAEHALALAARMAGSSQAMS